MEIDITATETLIRETCIDASEGHVVCESEYDACEGRRVGISYWEPDDLRAEYDNQCRTAKQCLQDCAKVLTELIKDKAVSRFYAHIDLVKLKEECEEWEQESFSVNED